MSLKIGECTLCWKSSKTCNARNGSECVKESRDLGIERTLIRKGAEETYQYQH